MSLCERVLKSCTSRGTAGGGASSSVPEWPSRHVSPLSSPLTCEQAAAEAKQQRQRRQQRRRSSPLSSRPVCISERLHARDTFSLKPFYKRILFKTLL